MWACSGPRPRISRTAADYTENGLIVALLLGIAALQLASPYLTKVAIDRAIPARDLGLVKVLALAFLAANAAQHEDGLLDQFGHWVKFGLMTGDHAPVPIKRRRS